MTLLHMLLYSRQDVQLPQDHRPVPAFFHILPQLTVPAHTVPSTSPWFITLGVWEPGTGTDSRKMFHACWMGQ